ncbi:MAG: hypothetical protein PHQ23_17610, partial [Candidatus Wallbacteria bacterium]|nr:hypothetical protein [Candidatus Wallbacteria bacterium]
EQMWDFVSNCPHTAHTTNPVPFIAINTGAKSLRSGGRLADVALTILGNGKQFSQSSRKTIFPIPDTK